MEIIVITNKKIIMPITIWRKFISNKTHTTVISITTIGYMMQPHPLKYVWCFFPYGFQPLSSGLLNSIPILFDYRHKHIKNSDFIKAILYLYLYQQSKLIEIIGTDR